MKTNKENNIDNSYITLRDIWEIFVGNIWLFILSVAICVSLAMCYIAITPPNYQRTASIMIKNDKQGQSMGEAAFESMGLVQSNTDINNEIHILATSQLMEEVVSRLALHYNYGFKSKGIRWIDLYRSAPFVVELDEELSGHNVSLNIITDGASQYEVSKLTIDGREIECQPTWRYSDSVSTPFGQFIINREENGVAIEPRGIYSFSKRDIASTARDYSNALVVALRDPNALIIDLSITMGSRQKAEDLLNMLISVYNENWIKDKNLVSLSTTNFINERLAIIAKELGDVDENISSYKSANLLPDVGAVAGMNLQSSNEILKQQIELNNQLSMAKYILNYIEGSDTSNQLLPVNSGVGSSAIDDQIAKYNEVLLQKNTLLANSSVNNPIVSNLITELQSMKNVLILSMNDLINTLDIQIENTRKEEIAAQKRLSNNPSQELYLLSTGREQMIKEELYLFLLQKREENELNQAFTAYNTKILSLARGSDAPVTPQKNIILLISICLGTAIPIIFIIIKRSLNTTIRTKDDISGLTIPFLGSIPQIGSNSKGLWRVFHKSQASSADGEIVVDNSRDVVNESFRLIRTNLDFMLPQNSDCKCINITSYNPGSGKSFIAVNLAVSMAIKNKKTIVIDCDFRRGTLSECVDQPSRGVVGYLSGAETHIEDLIINHFHNQYLDILPMGTTPPNPTELLLNDNLTTLVDWLKSKYDYIFFDCPPIEIVPDAMIIERLCDSTIFITRAGLMDRRLLPDLEELYQSERLKNISLILNGVDYKNMSRYGYGKYSYGGYGAKITLPHSPSSHATSRE